MSTTTTTTTTEGTAMAPWNGPKYHQDDFSTDEDISEKNKVFLTTMSKRLNFLTHRIGPILTYRSQEKYCVPSVTSIGLTTIIRKFCMKYHGPPEVTMCPKITDSMGKEAEIWTGSTWAQPSWILERPRNDFLQFISQ